LSEDDYSQIKNEVFKGREVKVLHKHHRNYELSDEDILRREIVIDVTSLAYCNQVISDFDL